MTRVGLWLGGGLLIVLLSGCIQQFIPNQSVGNLYGFNNFNIDMSVSSLGGASALIAGQAEAFVAAGTISRTVDTSDADVFDGLPFDPTNLSESVRAKSVRLYAPPAVVASQAITDVLPESLSLTSATFDVLFTDGNMSITKQFVVMFDPGATFDRDDANCTPNRCDYLPVGEAVASLDVALGAQDVVKVLAILMSNLDPKTAQGDAVVGFADDPLLADVDQARLTIETFDGTLGFK